MRYSVIVYFSYYLWAPFSLRDRYTISVNDIILFNLFSYFFPLRDFSDLVHFFFVLLSLSGIPLIRVYVFLISSHTSLHASVTNVFGFPNFSIYNFFFFLSLLLLIFCFRIPSATILPLFTSHKLLLTKYGVFSFTAGCKINRPELSSKNVVDCAGNELIIVIYIF